MNVMEPEEPATFIKKSPAVSLIERRLSLARDLLLNRIFLGCYEERRYVVQLKEYRDVVTISSAESELKTDLDAVNKDLRGIYGIKWFGVTGPEAESFKPGYYCLWVKLSNVPFGSFWFQIKQIKYEHEEIIFRLKCLRPVRPQDYEGSSKDAIPESGDSNKSEVPAEYSFDFDPVEKTAKFYAALNETILQVRPHLTWNNFVLISKFIFVLIFVLFSAALTVIRSLGDYFIRLVREVTLLLNALTPVFIQIIDFFTKIVGGVFILIALIIRGNGTRQLQNQFQSQQRNDFHPRQDLPKLMPAPPAQDSGFSANNPIIVPRDWRERNQNLKMELLTWRT